LKPGGINKEYLSSNKNQYIMITDNDSKSQRCPMLGHEVQFSYCRTTGGSSPCRKIFDCWWQTFDITKFMEECYTKEQLAEITSPPKPKMLSLFELIEQAKQNSLQKNGN
jgi:hypothetical protein